MQNKPAIFVDVNIFLDVLWKNKGWESSFEIIEKVRNNEIQGFTSVLTIAIIYFFYSREFPGSMARAELVKTIKMFEISDNRSEHAKAALKDKRFSDIEDALQFYSAKTVAKILVTRNRKDFRKVTKEIKVLTPEEFLEEHYV